MVGGHHVVPVFVKKSHNVRWMLQSSPDSSDRLDAVSILFSSTIARDNLLARSQRRQLHRASRERLARLAVQIAEGINYPLVAAY